MTKIGAAFKFGRPPYEASPRSSLRTGTSRALHASSEHTMTVAATAAPANKSCGNSGPSIAPSRQSSVTKNEIGRTRDMRDLFARASLHLDEANAGPLGSFPRGSPKAKIFLNLKRAAVRPGARSRQSYQSREQTVNLDRLAEDAQVWAGKKLCWDYGGRHVRLERKHEALSRPAVSSIC
jgi:hypothetical protein